jgi:hypothetical protein
MAWTHNILKEVYLEGLKFELAHASKAEDKKAIQAEIDGLEQRTADAPEVPLERA